MKPENKVAVVTGSAGGLGKAIAERLAIDGFNIVIHIFTTFLNTIYCLSVTNPLNLSFIISKSAPA